MRTWASASRPSASGRPRSSSDAVRRRPRAAARSPSDRRDDDGEVELARRGARRAARGRSAAWPGLSSTIEHLHAASVVPAERRSATTGWTIVRRAPRYVPVRVRRGDRRRPDASGSSIPPSSALREFLHRASALQVQAVVDRGDRAARARHAAAAPSRSRSTAASETVHLPHGVELEATAGAGPARRSRRSRRSRSTPRRASSPARSAASRRWRARRRGARGRTSAGRSVALAFYPTTDAELPLGIAARAGETPSSRSASSSSRCPTNAAHRIDAPG